jgi:hypothetical protein
LHALLRTAEMGRENIFPAKLFLCQKPVGRLRLSPAVAGMGMLAVGLSASRSNSVTERLLSRASPKSIPTSSCAAHSWLMAASIENHGTGREKFSCV